jgi:hypothetical protein
MPKKQINKHKAKHRCGLCGKTEKLIQTECCGNWICDDTDKYVVFSYKPSSCYRNHSRYTLCASHYNEKHSGNWKTCAQCREAFETEMFVWYGTNEHNFEVIENPPTFEPTCCDICGVQIRLGIDSHTVSGDEYWCSKCTNKQMRAR